MSKFNTFLIISIIGGLFMGIYLIKIIRSEYFLATSEEGVGVVKEVLHETTYRKRGRRASQAVPVHIPLIRFTDARSGKEYSFEAQAYERYFPGQRGDSVSVRYKIRGNHAEGIIYPTSEKNTFFSRNKINLAYLALGFAGLFLGYLRVRRKATSE